MSHQEDPVLATWRFGLGRAAAFTSDAKAKWAVLWLRWGTSTSSGPSSRAGLCAAARAAETNGRRAAHRHDGRGAGGRGGRQGRVHQLPGLQVGVVAPNRERSVIELEQVGPGRYRGRFPAPDEACTWSAMAQRKAIA